MSKQAVIFYHANCWDGLTALAVALEALNLKYDKIEHYAVQYKKEFPVSFDYLKSKYVFVLDFCFESKTMETIALLVDKLVIIDHHETARSTLDSFINGDVVFDLNKSGALLTWEYFYGRDETYTEIPYVIRVMDAIDRWQFIVDENGDIQPKDNTLHGLVDFYMGLMTNEMTLDNVRRILGYSSMTSQVSTVTTVLNTGNEINHFMKSILNSALQNSYYITFGDKKVLCHEKIPSNGSVVSNLLGSKLGRHSESKIAGIYSIDRIKQEVFWSLRSVDDVNVLDIAHQYGGGGHPSAAGFKMSLTDFEALKISAKT